MTVDSLTSAGAGPPKKQQHGPSRWAKRVDGRAAQATATGLSVGGWGCGPGSATRPDAGATTCSIGASVVVNTLPLCPSDVVPPSTWALACQISPGPGRRAPTRGAPRAESTASAAATAKQAR